MRKRTIKKRMNKTALALAVSTLGTVVNPGAIQVLANELGQSGNEAYPNVEEKFSDLLVMEAVNQVEQGFIIRATNNNTVIVNIDGVEHSVRLIGINGRNGAASYLNALAGEPIWLTRDGNNDMSGGILRRHLWTAEPNDSEAHVREHNVAARLIAQRFAEAGTIGNQFIDLFHVIQAEAEQALPEPEVTIPEVEIQKATVMRIVDGDTMEVYIDGYGFHSVRLQGFDAPEMDWSGGNHEPFAEAAMAYFSAMIGETVWLQIDTGRGDVADRFGRLLRHVWTAEPSDNEAHIRQHNVGARLLARGYANLIREELFEGIIFEQLFRTIVAEAQAAGVGIWGEEPETTVDLTMAELAQVTVTRVLSGTFMEVQFEDGTIEEASIIGLRWCHNENSDSAAYLRDLVEGRQVWIQREGANRGAGRLTRHVWLTDPTTGNPETDLVAAHMLRTGGAGFFVTNEQQKHSELLARIYEESRVEIVLPEVAIQQAEVRRVVDGDTIEVYIDGYGIHRVRLIGFDAPEMDWTNGNHEPFAEAAAEYLRALLGETIWLQMDPGGSGTNADNFNRLRRHVWIAEPSMEEAHIRQHHAGARILARGYADLIRDDLLNGTLFEELFRTILAEAQEAGLGLWAGLKPEGDDYLPESDPETPEYDLEDETTPEADTDENDVNDDNNENDVNDDNNENDVNDDSDENNDNNQQDRLPDAGQASLIAPFAGAGLVGLAGLIKKFKR